MSRGIFNQGYHCLKCGQGTHKECLGRLGICGRTGEDGGQTSYLRKLEGAIFLIFAMHIYGPVRIFPNFSVTFSLVPLTSLHLLTGKISKSKRRIATSVLMVFGGRVLLFCEPKNIQHRTAARPVCDPLILCPPQIQIWTNTSPVKTKRTRQVLSLTWKRYKSPL